MRIPFPGSVPTSKRRRNRTERGSVSTSKTGRIAILESKPVGCFITDLPRGAIFSFEGESDRYKVIDRALRIDQGTDRGLYQMNIAKVHPARSSAALKKIGYYDKGLHYNNS